jgi:hypothetical protein
VWEQEVMNVLDETELHPAIVAAALLSVAIISAGILWVWFPDNAADDEYVQDERAEVQSIKN